MTFVYDTKYWIDKYLDSSKLLELSSSSLLTITDQKSFSNFISLLLNEGPYHKNWYHKFKSINNEVNFSAPTKNITYTAKSSYRTSSMAHPNVTLDVKCRCSSKSESFHVCINDCFVHWICHSPGALKFGNQFCVDWAAMMVNELNFLICPIVGKTIIHNEIKSIYFKINKLLAL